LTAHIHAPALDQGVWRLLLIYVMTFGAAALSWHFFERPLALLKDRLFPSSAVARPV
jgi:peptidoglycan/LPS O-acetylase OafA/YrhL